jgi:hypothetical protein
LPNLQHGWGVREIFQTGKEHHRRETLKSTGLTYYNRLDKTLGLNRSFGKNEMVRDYGTYGGQKVTYKVLSGKPEGERPLGIHRHR